MTMKKVVKGIFKAFAVIVIAAIAYTCGKDKGYDEGYKYGCKATEDDLKYGFENEGNAIFPKNDTKGDCIEEV